MLDFEKVYYYIYIFTKFKCYYILYTCIINNSLLLFKGSWSASTSPTRISSPARYAYGTSATNRQNLGKQINLDYLPTYGTTSLNQRSRSPSPAGVRKSTTTMTTTADRVVERIPINELSSYKYFSLLIYFYT